MKKNNKFLCLLLISLFVLTGCTNKDMKKAYEKMEVNDNMNGYEIDCRLYGYYNNKNVNDIVRIENYMNREFNIRTSDLIEEDGKIINKETELILKDGKLYEKANENMFYKESSSTTIYNSTDIYLKGVLEGSKVKQLENETIADNQYRVYEMYISKSVMTKIMEHTSLKEYKVEDKVYTKVWVNEDGYVYQVEYKVLDNLEDKSNLTLNVTFFGYNASRPNNIILEDQL